MVVPTATDFSRALLEPLQVIEELYVDKGQYASTFVADVQSHFETLFATTDAQSKIPILSTSSLSDQLHASTSLGQPRLIRWTCMVQDTSMGNEYVPRHIRGQDDALHNGLFGASLVNGSDGDRKHVAQPLCDVATLYGVTTPAQTTWLTGDVDGEREASAHEGLFVMSKLPRGEPIGSLLKVYNESLAESLRVGQVVDVIGILDTSISPNADWLASGSADDVAESPALLTIHAISIAPHQQRDLISRDNEPRDAATLRSNVIDLVASTIGGDVLAARCVFLATIARIHTRASIKNLGHLSFNLSNMPTPTSANAKTRLAQLLELILAYVAEQSLVLTHLNDPQVLFAPRNDADESGLRAGRLQLAEGTLLLVDEGSMEEGQLQEHGMANIRALSTVLTSQKLPYHFPFSDLQMDIDLPCIVMSQGNSFLPIGLQLPLSECRAEDIYGILQFEDDPRDMLPTLRQYLRHMQSLAASPQSYYIPSSISQQIQDDFVQSRKDQSDNASSQTGADVQELFSQTLEIARLLCISRGGDALAWQDWLEAKDLQEQRTKRRTALQARAS